MIIANLFTRNSNLSQFVFTFVIRVIVRMETIVDFYMKIINGNKRISLTSTNLEKIIEAEIELIINLKKFIIGKKKITINSLVTINIKVINKIIGPIDSKVTHKIMKNNNNKNADHTSERTIGSIEMISIKIKEIIVITKVANDLID